MAPDFEKKREPRRGNSAATRQHQQHHQQQQQQRQFIAPTGSDIEGMLLMRCAANPQIATDHYYRHGNNTTAAAAAAAAAGRTSSTANSSSARSTITSSGRSHSARRLGPQQRHQQQRSHQQQVQQAQQAQQAQHQTRSSLSSLSTVVIRNSDEPCTARPNGTSAQDICDNSNDSGLGFEERQQQQAQQQQLNNSSAWNGVGEEDTKRRKMDIKLESEDANFAFPEVGRGASVTSSSSSSSSSTSSTSSKSSSGGGSSTGTSSNGGEVNKAAGVSRSNGGGGNGIGGASAVSSRTGNGNGTVGRVVGVTRPRPAMGVYTKRPPPAHQGPVTLTSQLCSSSRDGKTQLQIICQPEQQHRARYQTEGSRGAVKDRTGNGFPIVRLVGYDKPATLQVFIGTDLGRVAPHMFYQACRVSGKNSTPCVERKLDGTIVIEVDMDPTKDMLVTCDCVGILKERNVDVEHRFPQEAGVLQGRSKKKSTRCRMVFRTTITHADGTNETLQVCSQPIVCTQPPGIPEICKKSLTSCPCTGGLELFVLGKNFLKDTRVVFQVDNEDLSSSLEPHWECAVTPDKEFLQQTHLVCVVPAYRRQDLAPSEAVSVKLYAVSSGKTSEPHTFLYTASSTPPEPSVGKIESSTPPLVSASNDTATLSTSPAAAVPLAAVANSALIPQAAAVSPNFLTSIQQSQPASQQSQQVQSECLKSDPSPPPSSATSQATPVMMWAAQAANCQNTVPDVMMPPPNLVANPLLNRRSSSNHQLIIPDNLKTEVLDDSSENSMLSENSMQSMPTPTSNGASGSSPLHQLVGENSLDASQSGMIRSAGAVSSLGSPAQEAVGILGVVDLMRNQHPLTLSTSHQSPFGTMHEQTHVKVLSPHHINKDVSAIIPNEATANGPTLQGAGVVDLRMKHHQSEYNTLSNFTTTPAGQPLPAQSGQSIEKYLNHIESTVVVVPKEPETQENNFVGAIQQRASIIATNRPQAPPQQTSDILSPNAATVKLDALVNSAADSHQMVSPMRNVNTSPNGMMGQLSSDHESINSPQQTTRTSPPIPVKTMLLEALMPTSEALMPTPLTANATTGVVNGGAAAAAAAAAAVVTETSPEESLLTSINAALLPPMQEPPVVTAAGLSNPTVSVSAHNPLQVSSEPMPRSADQQQQQQQQQQQHIQQIQALTEQDVVMQQQVQQVEQVVAQAQQQVEQVVAQAQQQAVQAVQQAQQQVYHQVVQHAQVVQQAVQQVQAAQQVQAVPEVQQAVQQATQEVVQQAVQQATQEVVQQVQAVQQAVQQAQAAQAMQHAVQQDIGSMLNQPAGFVAEASSVLASGAAQEPCQQRLTNAAEQAINSVITNATQDIINNRPITTTTAHAIIATKNILNSVATQSAQLMNSAMEGILPKSPSAGQGTIAEQVSRKSPPVPMPVNGNRQNPNNAIQNAPPTGNGQVIRKPEDDGSMLPQELTSMSEHDLLSYINPSCFDPQGGFLM